MNGFENELQKRILGVIPHVTLESSGGFEDLENISEIILEDLMSRLLRLFFRHK